MRTLIAVCSISFALVCTAPTSIAQSIFKPVRTADSDSWSLEPTNQQSFLTDLLTADIVIIGERHGRKAHQNIEARLLRAFSLVDRRPSLVLELLKPEQMSSLLNHRASNPLNASGLGAALEWWSTGWPSWHFYQPLFQAAYDANLPILPADLNAEISTEIEDGATTSSASTSEKNFPVLDPAFQFDLATMTYVRDSWAGAMRRAHCDLIDDNRLAEVTALQIARDQSMAFSALQALALNPDQPVVLVVGSSHARADRSVPLYLTRALPQLKVMTLALREANTPEQPSKDLLAAVPEIATAPFDYVWQTVKIENEDQCDRLKDLFGRL